MMRAGTCVQVHDAGRRQQVEALPHTPVTILTGFLGSGKTTLLNRALRDPAMANTAVVINEFGEIGLDHLLAAQSDDTIMVLENGCLCCTVFGDLVTTLNNLYHAREDGEIPRFDHVVLETSGLADPAALIQAFLSDPPLAGLYRIGAVVATVDAGNGPGTLDRHVESVRQVALADQILISKLDLIAAAQAEAAATALTARLRRLNPAAEISRIDGPAFDVGALLRSAGLDPANPKADVRAWLNAAAYERQDGHERPHEPHAHHGDHDHHHGLHDRDIASFCFVREQPIARGAAPAARRSAAEPRPRSVAGERYRPCRRGARPSGRDPGRPASPAQPVMARPLAGP